MNTETVSALITLALAIPAVALLIRDQSHDTTEEEEPLDY